MICRNLLTPSSNDRFLEFQQHTHQRPTHQMSKLYFFSVQIRILNYFSITQIYKTNKFQLPAKKQSKILEILARKVFKFFWTLFQVTCLKSTRQIKVYFSRKISQIMRFIQKTALQLKGEVDLRSLIQRFVFF